MTKYLSQEQINEMHALLDNHGKEKGYRPTQMLAFLTSTFVGTMEMHGYSQDFMDRTCDMMKKKFREKRNKNE